MSRHRQSAASPEASARPATNSFVTPALAIAAVALSLRLLHLWGIHDSPFFTVLIGDARAHDAWAQRLAAGDWFGPEAFVQAPLYSYVVGVIYAVAGRDLLLVRLMQALLGAAAAALLGYAGWRLVSRPAGIVAGLLLAAWAPAIFLDGLLQASSIEIFLVCAVLALIARVGAGPARTWPSALLGLAMGAFALTGEHALILAAVIAAWLLISPEVARVRRALVFVACLAAVLVPVAARAAAVGGFRLTASPSTVSISVDSHAGTERAQSFTAAEPGGWLRLLGQTALLLVNRTDAVDSASQESYAAYSWPLRLLGPATHFGVLVPLAAAGMAVLWPGRRRLWVLYALAAARAASLVLLAMSAGSRHTLLPMLLIFAAAALAATPRVRAGWRPAPAVVLAILGLAVAANWPMPEDSDAYLALGDAAMDAGDPNRAVAAYRRALERTPGSIEAGTSLANALAKNGDTAGALAAMLATTNANPTSGVAFRNLGVLLTSLGAADDARLAFRKAAEVAPGDAVARYDYGAALLDVGRFEEAALEFRAAIAARADYAEAFNNLGVALASQERLPEAIAAFQRALQLQPDFAGARQNLALAEGARSQGR